MYSGDLGVREATVGDAASCVAIYRPYVEETAISWEIDVPTVAEMGARISGLVVTHGWLVLENGDRIVGFAYAQPLKRFLPALQWSAEIGIYLEAGHHRAGWGTLVYEALLSRLGERGYRRVIAGITEPNEASIAFHRSLGFDDAGRYRRVLWKLGTWHDVAWMQRDLQDGANRDFAPSDRPPCC